MQKPNLYPLVMTPSLHVKVWGGRRLETMMGKSLPTDEPYGEAWEVHDTAAVANGALAGKTLGEVLSLYGHDLVGEKNDPALGFPLLVKLLDATDWLSVQVHPNDEQAQRYDQQPRGKTEAWYVLNADEGAQLVYGMKSGMSGEEMDAAIRENRLEPLLNMVEVQAADALFVSPGTVHALGPGLLIYEIQQSSDLTYRLYDWGRVGLDGKPRDLHIEKGVAVSITAYTPNVKRGDVNRVLVECPYFRTSVRIFDGELVVVPTEAAFHLLTVIDGALTVEAEGVSESLVKGQSAVIPASISSYTVAGSGKLLTSYQP